MTREVYLGYSRKRKLWIINEIALISSNSHINGLKRCMWFVFDVFPFKELIVLAHQWKNTEFFDLRRMICLCMVASKLVVLDIHLDPHKVESIDDILYSEKSFNV